jgi:hypothetical protein
MSIPVVSLVGELVQPAMQAVAELHEVLDVIVAKKNMSSSA